MNSYIQDYWREMDDLRRVAGAENEGSVSQAFAVLLRASGQEHKLILKQQHEFKGKGGAKLRVDGVLMDRLRLIHGWWEAKDSKDDLDKEIEAKFAKGYPADNIIFEDTITSVLYQDGKEVMRVQTDDAAGLEDLLDHFYGFRPREVQAFDEAAAKFREDLPTVIKALAQMIEAEHSTNATFRAKQTEFLGLCKRAIGERIDEGHVREMLIQHILTDQIFRDIFPSSEFHRANHLARAIADLELTFLRGEARHKLLTRMEPYYAAIRRSAGAAVSANEKQDFLKAVYEDFYAAYNPKDADRLGIVYTPHEVVRFIIEGAEWLAGEHFGRRLSDPGMDILDPCTGTGTFIVDLIDHLRGDRQALGRKFEGEIHANEIAILPYYIACLNIEQTFYDAFGQWRDFKGACFVNTLENWGFGKSHEGAISDIFGSMTDENHTRIVAQNARRIPVILGNPPYNANQQSENDDNKNEPSPQADKRIKETYLSESNAQKTKLYDPFVRFFRWASDRIGGEGVIGFITNRSYLDKIGFDGFRKIVGKEFNEIWIVDLLGDGRAQDGVSAPQGGNIFGILTGVAIGFFVRDSSPRKCTIHYIAVPPFPTGREKLRWLATNKLHRLATAGEFVQITPNVRGGWINQPEHDWSDWLPVASKDRVAGPRDHVLFKLHSLGISTNRDAWLYGFTPNEVGRKVRHFLKHYNGMVGGKCDDGGIKWSESLRRRLKSKATEPYDAGLIRGAVYRPFVMRYVYFSALLIDRPASAGVIFPVKSKNEAIVFTNPGSQKPFSASVVNSICDLHFVGAASGTVQLPEHVYASDGTRHDNISDWALEQFRERYTIKTISKRNIFAYVYAVLNDPAYRERFSRNLREEFPRIPFYPDFQRWVDWGDRLIELHSGFERVKPWPLKVVEAANRGQEHQHSLSIDRGGKQQHFALEAKGPKCLLRANRTDGVIEIDVTTRLVGIPPEAWDYRLGNRSALEWVLEEYRETTSKDQTIAERFDTYRFADHKDEVIDLLSKVCRVSVETMLIIAEMKQTARA
ncbi:MAG: type ISP restriction/modification enzyme [Burkholderiales bacterium]